MTYQDKFGILYEIQQTRCSKLSRSRTNVYRVHVSFSYGERWMLEAKMPEFKKRWWRRRETGETVLRAVAEKYGWKRVKD